MADLHDGVGQLAEPEGLGALSIWGLVTESVRVFRSHIKLFMALTLTVTLPVCAVYNFKFPTGRREQTVNGDQLHIDFSELLLAVVIYLLAPFAFSLLSTPAIIYSVACIYSERITSYKKVLSVVPRVGKRLIVTFLWALLLMFVYAALWVVAILIIGVAAEIIVAFTSARGSDFVIKVVVLGGMMGCFVGIVCLSCIWHLARVVTVLEASYGLGAMRKSLKLITGRRLVAFCLFFIYYVMAYLINSGLNRWVVHGSVHRAVAWRVVLGCVLILLLSFLELMDFLVQTVFYFACRSRHHGLQLSTL